MFDYVPPEPMASPCTGVCAIDPERDWCLGCGRTIDEIADWSAMGTAARTATLALLPARMGVLNS